MSAASGRGLGVGSEDRHSRALMLVPFLLGGLAGAWLAITSLELVIVAFGWACSILAAGAIALLLTAAPTRRQPHGRLVAASERSAQWRARPLWSFLVRSVAIFAPIGVSLSTALAIQQTFPGPGGASGLLWLVLILVVCGFAILYPAERATRRLGPIAMLLKLSLAFPSSAPSRFRVARRSTNPGQLRRSLQPRYTPDDSTRTEVAGTLLSLLAALTAHDSRTRGHSERVRVFTEMLAEELGLDEPSRERLRWAALLHDIGKLSVAGEVLNKPGPLEDSEWRMMHRHPEEGARLIAPLAPWLGRWSSSIAQHHERLDGTGYPLGLSEAEISLGARIIAVADAFDTMVTPRSYGGAISPSAARQEVAAFSSRQFDPGVVRALLSLSIPRLWWRIGFAAWLAQLPLLRWTGAARSRRARASSVPIVSMLIGLGIAGALAGFGLLADRAAGPPGGGRSVQAGGARPSAEEATVVEEIIESASDSPPSAPPGGAEVPSDAASEPEDGGGGSGGGGGPGGGGDANGGGSDGGEAVDQGTTGQEGTVGGAGGDGGETPGSPPEEPGPPEETPPPESPPPGPPGPETGNEPGVNGQGNANGHTQQVEDGEGLPPGQAVADGEKPKGGRKP